MWHIFQYLILTYLKYNHQGTQLEKCVKDTSTMCFKNCTTLTFFSFLFLWRPHMDIDWGEINRALLYLWVSFISMSSMDAAIFVGNIIFLNFFAYTHCGLGVIATFIFRVFFFWGGWAESQDEGNRIIPQKVQMTCTSVEVF